MWSSEVFFNRRAVLLGLCALAACGYEPVNSPTGAAAGLKSGDISVRAPTRDDEYTLVERLEQRVRQLEAILFSTAELKPATSARTLVWFISCQRWISTDVHSRLSKL